MIPAVSLGPNLIRSLLSARLREIGHQLTGAGDSFNIVLEGAVADTRDLAVHLSTSELLLGHSLLCDGLDDLWPSDEHVRGILNHEGEISKSR